MRRNTLLRILLLISILVLAALAQAPMPKMTAVEPAQGKAGDQITITGENLDKANVAEIYLTDGNNDLKLSMSEQAAASIKFTIPAKAKAGRFSLMLMTAGAAPKLIEQPVKLTVQ